MNVGPVGASPQQIPQQQPQIRQLERIEFQDDAGVSYRTFDNASAGRIADTNQTRTGFGIDLNGDRSFSGDTDGFLAFDLDGDGKYSSEDVQATSNYLKALSGETDLNGDGRVSFQERSDAHNMVKQFGSADLDQDGVISGWEISELGGKVVKLGTNGDGETTSTIQEIPGFESDRNPPKPSYLDPRNAPPNPEFEAWRNNMTSQWSAILGLDLAGMMSQIPQNNFQMGQGTQFPPITAQQFARPQQINFPQFNFPTFDPMAGQSFGPNGFPSFFSSGIGLL